MIERTEPDPPPSERVKDVRRISAALRKAISEALARHKRAGRAVPVWRDEQVVWIQPADIPELSGELEDERR